MLIPLSKADGKQCWWQTVSCQEMADAFSEMKRGYGGRQREFEVWGKEFRFGRREQWLSWSVWGRKKRGKKLGKKSDVRGEEVVEGAWEDDGGASPLSWQMKCCTRRRDLFHRQLQTRRGCWWELPQSRWEERTRVQREREKNETTPQWYKSPRGGYQGRRQSL